MPGDDVAKAPLESNDQSPDCGENAATATITALLPRGAKGIAFTVELSNGERLTLRSETVATHRLSVGDTVDSAAITAWQRDNNARLAVEAGLNFISFRPRSTKEVADHLRKKSLDTAARDHAIGRLQELGYLDDAAFARFWVESRDTHRPRGRRALSWELRQKGIDDALIEDVLERFADDEAPLAYAAARKRAASLKTTDPAKFRQQLGGFLARRGFGFEVVDQVVNDLWGELRGDDSRFKNRVDT